MKKQMNIIIPIGGKGERFSNDGFLIPKPIIPVFEKTIVEHVIDHLNIQSEDRVFIIYDVKLDAHNFSDYIAEKYKNVTTIPLNSPTIGAAETVYKGIEIILENHQHYDKTILFDCDTFYTEDMTDIFRKETRNVVFCRQDTKPEALYSYICYDADTKEITRIAEKNKISDYANTGCYAFQNIRELLFYAKRVVRDHIFEKNEPYISCVIGEMLREKHIFAGWEVPSSTVFSLGTPKELKQYLNDVHAFLFDLDGTLVLTKDLYFFVWTNILKKYNVNLTNDMFANYIEGNSDATVINILLKERAHLSVVSCEKDSMVLENLNLIKIIPGVENILKNIYKRGHKISVVTNSNRAVAIAILKHLNLDKYIDFTVSADDSKLHKPYPDPYLLAIKNYSIQVSRAIIFEDSKPGFLSALSVQPKCLVGLTTLYDKAVQMSIGVDHTIENYIGLDLDYILQFNKKEDPYKTIKPYILKLFKNNTALAVDIRTTKLKGGFIADVLSLTVRFKESTRDFILKMETKNDTSLSKMASSLDLYNREYQFYESVSRFVEIKIPEFVGIVRDDNGCPVGILMENMLSKRSYVINLNLNEEDINVSLKIVARMAKLHADFWNKDTKVRFPQIRSVDDPIFSPAWSDFLKIQWPLFKAKWENVLTHDELQRGEAIVSNFGDIQKRMATGSNTIVHGDIKSPNIFYNLDNDKEPYFIDWQHIVVGKGVQDLVFFIIESFDINNINLVFPLFKSYYYIKLKEHKIAYTIEEYDKDITDAVSYVPVFTAIWFGTLSDEDLIDKTFPICFIKKLFCLLTALNNLK